MAYQHTRDPYDLDDDKYGEFSVKMKQFLAEDNSLPYRPTQFVAEQIVRADAYIVALDEFHTAESNMQTASRVVKAAVDGISAKLRWFKYILPTMIIGPDTLIEEFGLDGEMPVEYAEIKNLGDEVMAHWNARRAEPIFAPIVADGDLLAGILASYDSAVAAQNTAQNVYSMKSVAKNEARDSHHEIEREIFNWYRAHYPKPEDDYWVKTPWGKSSGGEEEPPVEYPVFPEPPDIFTAEDKGGGMTEVVYGYVDGSTHGLLERRKVGSVEPWIEVSDHLPMDKDNMLPYRELHVPPGEWEYRFTPMNGDEHGASVSATVVVGE